LRRDFGLFGFTDKKTFGRSRPKVFNGTSATRLSWPLRL